MFAITCERICVFLVNIFCPPIAVLIVAGPGPDCLLNTFFFIAGVLPGHIHGFYITCTYFHRKRKVQRGIYPGGKKAGIWSEKVWNGDASNAKVRELWDIKMRREQEEEDARVRKREKRGSWRGMSFGRSRHTSMGHQRMESVRSSGARGSVRERGTSMREAKGWRL